MSRKKLIVNADDFGLHPDINRAVEQAHREGILTSASLAVNGEAFEDALDIAGRNKRLGIGLHLNLVGERPVAAAEKIDSIVDEKGMLYEDHRKLCIRILRKQVPLKHIVAEARAQIDKFYAAGLIPTHIDSHRHLHLFPPIFKAIQPLLEKYKIRKMRYLNIPHFEFKRSNLYRRAMAAFFKYFSRRQRNKFKHPDYFFGFFDSGNLDKEYMLYLLGRMKAGITEVNLHPGSKNADLAAKYSIWNSYFPWSFNWERELNILLHDDLKSFIKDNQITLITYSHL